MKHLTLLFLLFFSFSLTSLAQKVVLCEDYNKTDGTPTGINKNWDISKDGGSYVYILYSQDNIIKDKLMLYVDKKNTNGSYIAFDTQEFTYDPKTDRKKWAMYDYKFNESGDYRISVMGKADDALALTYTNIGYMKDEKSDTEKSDNKKSDVKDDASDTYYYEDSKITFSESIDDKGVMTGEAKEFKLKNGKRDFFCKLEQDNDLKCKEVSVTIYYGDGYKEKVSDVTYTVGGLDWNWIKVPVSVTKVGKYVVDIYNDRDTYIGSGYFEITK